MPSRRRLGRASRNSPKVGLDGVGSGAEHDRNGVRGPLRGMRRRGCAKSSDGGDAHLYKLGGGGGQTVLFTVGPSVFDREVLAFTETFVRQALPKPGHER